MVMTEHPTGERQASGRCARGHGVGSDPSTSPGWQPLAGAAILDRLRVTGRARPTADPAFVADLRSHLEDGLADPRDDGATSEVPGPELVVTKDRLTRALACPVHAAAEPFHRAEFSLPLACGALVGVLFRQLVTTGAIGDALTDGIDALAVDEHRAPLVTWIARLTPSERAELRAEVDRQADGLRRRWPALDPAWLPRTQECIRVPLAEARVHLVSRVDLAIGRPPGPESSVALLDVTAGSRRPGHRADLHFHALVETLRSGTPPFAVATYYARTGELDVDPVTPELLAAAARRCRAGLEAMVPVDSPGWAWRPVTRDHPWCAGCTEAPFQPIGPATTGGPVLAPAATAVAWPAAVPDPKPSTGPAPRPAGDGGALPVPADRAA